MESTEIFEAALKRIADDLPQLIGKEGWENIRETFQSLMEKLSISSGEEERRKLALEIVQLLEPYPKARFWLGIEFPSRAEPPKRSCPQSYEVMGTFEDESGYVTEIQSIHALPRRYFATSIKGGPEASGSQPKLLVNKRYDCVFSVKAEVGSGVTVEIPSEVLAKMRERQVQVLAVGDGLEIRNSFVTLTIDQDYTSGEASVSFNAVKVGPCSLQLLLMLDQNVVRTIRYDFLSVSKLGAILDASSDTKICELPKLEEYHRLGKKELQISVSRKGIDELELHFIWGTDSTIMLPIKETTLQDIENKKRAFLAKYCNSIAHVKTAKLSTEAMQDFLAELKALGDWIFNRLFILPSQQGLPQVGKTLQDLLRSNQPAPIQINAGRDPLPWMFLSDGEGVLGLRHGVEIIPTGMFSTDLDMIKKPLRILFGLAPVFKNVKLDDGRSVLDVQREVLDLLKSKPHRFEVILAEDEKQWIKALEKSPDVIYTYCHGKTEANESCFWMTQLSNAISINNIVGTSSTSWSRNPLTILVACTSGAIDPLRAIGLANSFMANGARGYIGVEGEVPSTFASLFMNYFFKDFFVQGDKQIGEVLFNLRSHFLHEMNNPWGILFTQFCRSEITVCNQ